MFKYYVNWQGHELLTESQYQNFDDKALHDRFVKHYHFDEWVNKVYHSEEVLEISYAVLLQEYGRHIASKHCKDCYEPVELDISPDSRCAVYINWRSHTILLIEEEEALREETLFKSMDNMLEDRAQFLLWLHSNYPPSELVGSDVDIQHEWYNEVAVRFQNEWDFSPYCFN